MRTPAVLVTGAGGEIGHALIARLASAGRTIVTIDVAPLDQGLTPLVHRAVTGSILDRSLLERLLSEFDIDVVYHLAALLSTRSEFTPLMAHEVNVAGTLNMLEFAQHQGHAHGRPVVFMYPSSVAVYGVPDLVTKGRLGPVREDEWAQPTTMYGCNKLYCEHLGRYYSRHYRQLAADAPPAGVDFRSIRFPGLVSAFTVPSGGTSDYGPEMLHAAAKGEPYDCFVREDARIPFMAMPDAIDALLGLMAAPAEALSSHVYNIGAFNPSAGEFAALVKQAFPGAVIRFSPDVRRQAIVDSWPEDVDDARARRDWGFKSAYDLDRAMSEYLLPNIKKRYARA